MSEEGPSWAELRPRRACEHRERERADGETRVTVLKPRIRARWLQRLLGSWRPSPYRIHLDDVGTFVWLRCDGSHSVAEIGEELSEAFGERVDPVEERLARFMQQLRKADLIEFTTGVP